MRYPIGLFKYMGAEAMAGLFAGAAPEGMGHGPGSGEFFKVSMTINLEN